MGIKKFSEMVYQLRMKFAEGKALVCPVIHKADFSPIDDEGNVVSFKTNGYWNSMTATDVIEYATMGVTN